MSGYPSQSPNYAYGYDAPLTSQQYGAHPPPGHGGGYPYASPFASLVPSTFPLGTDPNVVACFQLADQDGSGFIDNEERAMSSYNQSFSLRTIHLLMSHFTNSNVKKRDQYKLIFLFLKPLKLICIRSALILEKSGKSALSDAQSIFERFDMDRSGKIDSTELRDALLNMGYAVSPVVLDLLVSKFDKTGGNSKAIEYDNFIECCLTIKGLTENVNEKDTACSGSATFSYESFMLTVLPFLIA
ncbi:hypothetical protein Fmac_025112 [Flemingia macrophylla]|uniref:EF-hand domain-containing protein n=1 Tax=Flemingia macrophylla TaxID=520843 RepID=A0ABD1LRB8_9FABA